MLIGCPWGPPVRPLDAYAIRPFGFHHNQALQMQGLAREKGSNASGRFREPSSHVIANGTINTMITMY